MKIYFAGSITGGRDDRELYLKIIDHLKNHGEVLTEHIGDSNLSVDGESDKKDEFVYSRDTDWIRDSDVVVAEVTMPSLGVGYELGLAESLDKRVLCLYRPSNGKTLSSMVSGNSHNVVRKYSLLEEAFEHIDTYFASLKNPMKILVGSKNPVKIDATRDAFSKYFGAVQVVGVGTESGVPDQPINQQTYEGARNRASALRKLAQEQHPDAKYFVGIEGGIEETFSTWFSFGTICVIDTRGRESLAKSPHFTLPKNVVQKLLSGEELGDVMDHHTGKHNTKQKSGTIGILTNGIMDRKNLYVHGLVVALVPFVNDKLYFSE